MNNKKLTLTKIQILRTILIGNNRSRYVASSLNLASNDVKKELRELLAMDYIKERGLVDKRYALTSRAIDVLAEYGYMPQYLPKMYKVDKRRVIEHNTNIKSGFSAMFGAIVGIFAAWSIIGLMLSAVYWLLYTFMLKDLIQDELLSYIPMDNILVDILLGFLTSTVFLYARKRIKSII